MIFQKFLDTFHCFYRYESLFRFIFNHPTICFHFVVYFIILTIKSNFKKRHPHTKLILDRRVNYNLLTIFGLFLVIQEIIYIANSDIRVDLRNLSLEILSHCLKKKL